jgi:nucleotide-binding universal stress UspA family protein
VLLEAAQDADLLVVGNRGRGNITAALLGSTSAKVADEAPCPVVVVRAQPES